MPPSRPSSELRVQKKMRKGTHSCFECRRRKIRCIYSPDNPNVCTECFARGSRCIDQEHADPDVVVDHRKNLRERVARLESLVDTLLEDRSDRGAAEALSTLRGEQFPLTPSSHNTPGSSSAEGKAACGGTAPVLSLFNNAVISRAETCDGTSGATGTGDETTAAGSPDGTFSNALSYRAPFGESEQHGDRPRAFSNKDKHERTRQALLAVVPPYDQLLPILRESEMWWAQFRRKCPGTIGTTTTLEQFAGQALRNGTVSQLAVLVVAIGARYDWEEFDQYLNLVDRHVTSDDEYAASIGGMECILLLGKCYADIGQPRRAWLSFRRGLVFAQMLGLHRNHSMDAARSSIWWSLYQGDRFLSLMLGLPYGVNDSHCDMELRDASRQDPVVEFLLRSACLAGRVIDRNQGLREQTFSSALDLDQQLDTLALSLNSEWWTTEPLENALDFKERAKWQEKLLSQMCFHQTRVYLHMPFMLQSATNARYDYSRTACFEAAREMLRLFHLLRGGLPLQDCKAIDFVGFTACIVVVLGLLGYGRLAKHHSDQQDSADWRLIEITMDIFKRGSEEKGGMVAAQSYRVLQELSCVRKNGGARGDGPQKIAIPYFGTISVQRGTKFHPDSSTSSQTLPQTSAVNPELHTPASSLDLGGSTGGSGAGTTNASPFSQPQTSAASSSAAAASGSSFNDPFIAYDGFYMPTSSSDASGQIDDFAFGGYGIPGNGNGWQNMPNMGMDIDSDWQNFLLNDLHQQQQQSGFGMTPGEPTSFVAGLGGV